MYINGYFVSLLCLVWIVGPILVIIFTAVLMYHNNRHGDYSHGAMKFESPHEEQEQEEEED